MKTQLTLSPVIVTLLLLGSAQTFAGELPSDKELMEKCWQLSLQQQVVMEEQEEFVLQCALDLKRQYLRSRRDHFDQTYQDDIKTDLQSETL